MAIVTPLTTAPMAPVALDMGHYLFIFLFMMIDNVGLGEVTGENTAEVPTRRVNSPIGIISVDQIPPIWKRLKPKSPA